MSNHRNPWDLGLDVGIALLLGVIFLLSGLNYGTWLKAKLTGQPHDTGYVWGDAGAAAGKAADAPVEYFDLQGGHRVAGDGRVSSSVRPCCSKARFSSSP